MHFKMPFKKRRALSVTQTWFGARYAGFLFDHGFQVAAINTAEVAWHGAEVEVFQSQEVMLASTVLRHDGWTVLVAVPGSTMDADAILDRSEGWSLISEVWIDFYQRTSEARHQLPYPHALPEERERALFDQTFREFLRLVRSGELSIDAPRHRLEAEETSDPEIL
ncbi:hypothetical protein [Noviluteimonas gilva]|uniref:Uncharacterized protein n=1 Tax=Noviluteimonas gilva TaxID=2682097 RepID=A0A7C9HMQ8_9GAMM|nr:hypothetical protein [Lysobacter gilvus]MUV14737.1 hypothetical protein [Lysobacter gilvus]